jgi:hypothetical protein
MDVGYGATYAVVLCGHNDFSACDTFAISKPSMVAIYTSLRARIQGLRPHGFAEDDIDGFMADDRQPDCAQRALLNAWIRGRAG